MGTLTDMVRSGRESEVRGAIYHSEMTLTPHRKAPRLSEDDTNGLPRVTAAFAEWMMGLPEGWVTGVPGMTYTSAWKALGNGVVPQQAAVAIRIAAARAKRQEG